MRSVCGKYFTTTHGRQQGKIPTRVEERTETQGLFVQPDVPAVERPTAPSGFIHHVEPAGSDALSIAMVAIHCSIEASRIGWCLEQTGPGLCSGSFPQCLFLFV